MSELVFMERTNRTAVVIVTYNGAPWITHCLTSILESDYLIPQEYFIVVDNCSSDNTVALISPFLPKLTFIQSEENLGFGRANNIGIRLVLERGADFIFLLNQDAWVGKNTISTLVNLSLKNSAYGILSPIHLNGKGNDWDRNFQLFLQNAGILEEVRHHKKQALYEAGFINAAAWLLSKKCVETTGIFDPLFAHYGEDVNLVQRVKLKGFKLGVSPNTEIWHDRAERKAGEDASISYVKWAKIDVLCRLCNPEKHLLPELIALNSQRLLFLIKNLIRLNWKYMKANCLILYFLWGKTLSVIKSRKEYKKKGAFIKV